jgi:tRNA U38,U39,U40 pseudouridine synthase TruA
MLKHELRDDDEMLVLTPEGPLEAADFTALSGLVDAYLEQNGKLRGVMIQAKSFPGWKDFAALLAHLKFVKNHIKRIEKVVVVADGAFAKIIPQIANHFVHAQVRHLDLVHEDAAWDWLRQTGNAQRNSGA